MLHPCSQCVYVRPSTLATYPASKIDCATQLFLRQAGRQDSVVRFEYVGSEQILTVWFSRLINHPVCVVFKAVLL